MEETNFDIIQEKIDGLELLLSVYDKGDSKYIEIEQIIVGLSELQELYQVKEAVYYPKVITDGVKYEFLTKPSERYNVEELRFLYKLLETMVEDKQFKRLSAKELKTKLDLILIELSNIRELVNDYSKEIIYAMLWYNISIGLKSLKINFADYYKLINVELSMKDLIIEFNRMPFKNKKNAPIKNRGNFLKNKEEIKLVNSFTSNDDLRPQMTMINIQDDYAVSTDAHILVGLYDKKIGDKEVNYSASNGVLKTDKTINNYPKWKSIVPLPHQFPYKISIDLNATSQYLNKLIEYDVLNPTTYSLPIEIDNNKIFEVNAKFINKVINYFIKLGYKKVYMNYNAIEGKPILFTTIETANVLSIKQDFAILMPIMSGYNNGISLNYVTNEKFKIGGKIKNKQSSIDMMLQERRGI